MLENILLVVSILLIAIVLLQGNKASDAGGIITGGNENLFQHATALFLQCCFFNGNSSLFLPNLKCYLC